MALSGGTKLGPYEIIAPLGAGGMGEVYRAVDSRLGRTVAVKILPEHLSESTEAQQRFDREARAISSLSHPHICHLYDVGQQDGTSYLVMEYLEGETLADRLRKGPLPLDQVVRCGAEIAKGLHAAHRRGVVHRDLKPSNIMLARNGAKLMDFGLAKGVSLPKPQSTELAATMTSSHASPLTSQGTIVGTFQYMSPEQMEGKEADARSDIFSLGAVLYEMTTGKRAFDGKSFVSVAAAILEKEPEPLRALQPLTPPGLERVVCKCMAKDPDERWQSAADLASELGWIAENGPASAVTVAKAADASRLGSRKWMAWAGATAALVVAVAFVITHLVSREPQHVIRAQINTPEKIRFNFVGDNSGPPVISPDGARIVLSATVDGKNQLYMRAMDKLTLDALPGTEEATFPFWSPDSRSVAFFSGGKLKRIDIAGGPPVIVCDAPGGRGGTWASSGVILFAPNFSSNLFQVSASGGTPTAVTKLDAKYTTHRWPWFLPDGQHFLYLAANHSAPTSPDTALFVGSLDGKENRRLLLTRSSAIHASGYLLYVRDNALMAQAFDVSSRRLKDDPAVLNDDVQVDASVWRGTFTASNTGTLIYQPGVSGTSLGLTWFDRSGKELGAASTPDAYRQVELSPNGKKLLLSIGDPVAALWVYDLARNSKTRLTYGNEGYNFASWSPDGSQIAYTKGSFGTGGDRDILSKASNGAGEEKRLLFLDPANGLQQVLCDWSPDGRYLIYRSGTSSVGTGLDLWILPLFGERKPFPYITGPGDQFFGQFSADGHWVAYVSTESGRPEIYVAPFPWTGAKWQVSTSGGTFPRWRRDGTELFFLVPGSSRMMAAQVNGRGASFEVGATRFLFSVANMAPNTGTFQYAVTGDGQRFVITTTGEVVSLPLTLIQNWSIELKEKK